MRSIAVSALFLLAACASTGDRPSNIAQPGIVVSQAGPIFFGQQATTDVTVDVQITNRANVPITLREVEVSSADAEQYTIPRARRTFNETLAPGDTRTVQVLATAVAQNLNPRFAQPLVVRTFLRFEANGKTFREAVLKDFPPVP